MLSWVGWGEIGGGGGGVGIGGGGDGGDGGRLLGVSQESPRSKKFYNDFFF